MTEQEHILHFSLGPVQGFIGTARRTRDLWAGSFLLSWLTAQAMKVVREKKNGGRVVFPAVDNDPLVLSVERSWRGPPPRIGTVPNRFKAEVPPSFDPKRCGEAVCTAWQKLADAVRDEFLPQLNRKLGGNLPAQIKEIWDRQVWGFWEIAWVKGPADHNDGNWLEDRKTWRSHRSVDETAGGDHCTLMGDWQEISGYVRARERADQDTFWSTFRDCRFWDNDDDKNDDKKGKKLLLDIVEGERLCAIALIKRLFPRLTKGGRERVFGWDPCGAGGGNWPSTGHIAAAHWINKAWGAEQGLCTDYAMSVKNELHALHFAEQRSQIACLPRDGRFKELDANFFFDHDLENRRAMPLLDKGNSLVDKPEDKEHSKLRKQLILSIRELTERVGAPAGYFALLRMDGDDVGKLLDTLGADKVSPALAAFSKDVPGRVYRNNGVLVYAGGDDLLALFPIEDALGAALELRGAYIGAWPQGQAQTISAGLVFAHHHEPFRTVVDESRRLLEEVAKDGNGRDSIACSVLKPSDRAVEWVSAWTATDCSFLTERVATIAERMRTEPPFSNRFIYNLRTHYLDPIGDRFEALELTDAELDRILAAERAGSRELPKDADRDRERELVRTLRELTQPHPGRDAARSVAAPLALQPEALVLARFLAQKGLTVEGEKA